MTPAPSTLASAQCHLIGLLPATENSASLTLLHHQPAVGAVWKKCRLRSAPLLRADDESRVPPRKQPSCRNHQPARTKRQPLAHTLFVLAGECCRRRPASTVTASAECGHRARRQRLRPRAGRDPRHRRPALIACAGQEGGKADNVEWEVTLLKSLSPVGNHRREQSAILRGATDIGFALIPDGPRTESGATGCDHALVQGRQGTVGPVFVTSSGSGCGGRASTLNLPCHSPPSGMIALSPSTKLSGPPAFARKPPGGLSS